MECNLIYTPIARKKTEGEPEFPCVLTFAETADVPTTFAYWPKELDGTALAMPAGAAVKKEPGKVIVLPPPPTAIPAVRPHKSFKPPRLTYEKLPPADPPLV